MTNIAVQSQIIVILIILIIIIIIIHVKGADKTTDFTLGVKCL